MKIKVSVSSDAEVLPIDVVQACYDLWKGSVNRSEWLLLPGRKEWWRSTDGGFGVERAVARQDEILADEVFSKLFDKYGDL